MDNKKIDMNDLWHRWERHYKNLGIDPKSISRDGITNSKSFDNDRRILFILKETNKFPGGSLQDLLKNGPVYQMWHTLARWGAGIINDFPDYQTINNNNELTKAIHQIAVINLKKATGGSSANMSIIHAYAHQDMKLLREQIKDINPKMIIACGTFEPLIWLLDLNVKADNPYEKPAISRVIDCKVVPWRHPSRGNNMKTYRELRDLLRNDVDSIANE